MKDILCRSVRKHERQNDSATTCKWNTARISESTSNTLFMTYGRKIANITGIWRNCKLQPLSWIVIALTLRFYGMQTGDGIGDLEWSDVYAFLAIIVPQTHTKEIICFCSSIFLTVSTQLRMEKGFFFCTVISNNVKRQFIYFFLFVKFKTINP